MRETKKRKEIKFYLEQRMEDTMAGSVILHCVVQAAKSRARIGGGMRRTTELSIFLKIF